MVRNLGKFEKLNSMIISQTTLVSLAEKGAYVFIGVKFNFHQIYEFRVTIYTMPPTQASAGLVPIHTMSE